MQRDESLKTGGPASPDDVNGGAAAAVETWEGEGGTAARTQPARSKNPVKKPGQHVRRKSGKAAVCRAVMLATTLAAAVLGPGAPASATAANGSQAGARASAEYQDAVRRADKDYDAANRRCEVLALDERDLCRHDSTVARRAALAEARTKLRPGQSRTDAADERTVK